MSLGALGCLSPTSCLPLFIGLLGGLPGRGQALPLASLQHQLLTRFSSSSGRSGNKGGGMG